MLDDNTDQAEDLHSLEVAVCDRNQYWRLGSLKDLEKALLHAQEAVNLTPEGHPERAGRLHSLASSYKNQYQTLGDLQYLKKALQHNQEAVDITPEDHPERVTYLQTLAASYADQYQRLGDLNDLERALQNAQEGVNLTPESHPDRSGHLQSLAVLRDDRYQRLGGLQDLEVALQYKQEAVNLVPAGHLGRAGHLQSLAASYRDRYQRLGELQDLNKALQHTQEAVDIIPEGHPDRAGHLESLAASCGEQYQRLGDLKDLEAALQHKQEAVNLTPKEHPARPARQRNLAVSYADRYWRLHDPKDLDTAFRHRREAVNLLPGGHPGRAGRLQILAITALHELQRLKTSEDPECIQTFFNASFNITTTPELAWQNGLAWASFEAHFYPEHCISTLSSVFRFLPELLWIGHSIPARHNAIRRLDIPHAISTATRICISLAKLIPAVEIIEQGLGTVYQQMLELNKAIQELPPVQTQAFQRLSIDLYRSSSDLSTDLANKRNDLINNIREQPGFESFLLPKQYDVLRQASQGGPVIILNSHKDGCNGIIILNSRSNPVHVAFPNVNPDLLGSQRAILRKFYGHRVRGESASTRLFGHPEGWLPSVEQFEHMLGWLWNDIVSPVYQVLELHGTHDGRLWWLPTGAFSGLPLHACPPTDQFIHSYTATLGSLLDAYSKKGSNNVVKVGVVGVTHTGLHSERLLPGVKEEVRNIRSAVPKPHVECIEGQQATVEAVGMYLQDFSWVHLACHGTQDAIQPTKSCLYLYGGNLELEPILRMPLLNAEVIFLAGCETAMGDSKLVNESFHLGGGFIAAGFRGAIGTLWSMNDHDGPLVANLFYSHLFRNGRQPQASDAAEALHLAVKEVRKNVPYERWIPFIHMGI
ncbi:CHAT domain-containing protein [Mycena pura]|uniref:CHAT domain-containing protein n=1 Tax=Mycena pura TaxID=153505 RepID=A0AAD6UVN0_9AGAR|nr:CHAT domain-containing protein [Mycena pura]